MANELRVRQNFLGGAVEDNPLTAAATTLTSSALAATVAIGTTQHLPITLDPDGLYGEPEIAWITAHTSGATTATILRGQEGTTPRQHKQDMNWAHGPTKKDFDVLSGASFAAVATYENTASTAFADLATVGPAVSVATGTSALVTVTSFIQSNGSSAMNASVSYDISGATTVAASEAWGANGFASSASTQNGYTVTGTYLWTTLTPGLNTFTMKYASYGGTTVSWNNRRIVVIPL